MGKAYYQYIACVSVSEWLERDESVQYSMSCSIMYTVIVLHRAAIHVAVCSLTTSDYTCNNSTLDETAITRYNALTDLIAKSILPAVALA